ncbi:streptophobe family protein [Blastococcus sp. SYSU DS0617]
MSGDWSGALRAAGFSVLAMLGLALVGALLLAGGDLGVREVLALTAGAVCTAVGGDVFVDTSVSFSAGTPLGDDLFGDVDGSAGFGLLPLTLTLAGLTLLGRLFVRSLRARGVQRNIDVLLQGVRTVLVFTALFLPLALLTRYRADGNDELPGFSGRVGVSIWSTLTGALLFAVATLGLVWLFSRQTSTGLPRRLAALRAQAIAPLLGALAVFGAGVLGVLAFLVYGLVQLDDRLAQLGLLVLGGGNGMLASVLWSAGVPLDADAGLGRGFVGGPAGGVVGVGRSIDLFTFTDVSGWIWLAPVVLLLVLLAVATVLTVRQNSVEDARREGFRFAGALAVLAFVAALLLRIATDVEGGLEYVGSAGASATFNPVVAALVLAVWGLVAGLLGPVIATRIPGDLVTTLRARFGVAAPRPVAPAAPGSVGQGWQQSAPHHPTQQFTQQPEAYGQPPFPQQQPYAQPPQEQQPPYPQQQPPPPPPQ